MYEYTRWVVYPEIMFSTLLPFLENYVTRTGNHQTITDVGNKSFKSYE